MQYSKAFLTQGGKENYTYFLDHFLVIKSKLSRQNMSEIECDEEEQSFLRHVTSHLPSDWSDERRDVYIQHVLTSWRKHREHSRDEQRFMEKYISTIQENFKPQSPELYDFNQWPIDENLLAMLKRGSLDSDLVKQVCSVSLWMKICTYFFFFCNRYNHRVYILFLFYQNHFVNY
jgi:hypothetical protein